MLVKPLQDHSCTTFFRMESVLLRYMEPLALTGHMQSKKIEINTQMN